MGKGDDCGSLQADWDGGLCQGEVEDCGEELCKLVNRGSEYFLKYAVRSGRLPGTYFDGLLFHILYLHSE